MGGELCGNFLLGDLSRGRETINLGSGNTGNYTALGFGREKTIIQPLAELYSNINSYTAMDIQLWQLHSYVQHMCFKQAQPKICHSPKVDDGVDIFFKTFEHLFLDHFF